MLTDNVKVNIVYQNMLTKYGNYATQKVDFWKAINVLVNEKYDPLRVSE